MRKFLPYILILTIIVQIFAPFTIGSGVKNDLEIQTSKVEAADCDETKKIEYDNVFNINSAGNLTESNISLTTQVTASENEIRAYFNLILDTGEADSVKVANAYKYTYEYFNEFQDEDFVVVVKEKENNKVTGFIDVTKLILVDSEGKSLANDYPDGPAKSTISSFLIETGANPGIFSPDKNYIVTFYYQAKIAGNGCGESIEGLSDSKDYIPIASTEITIGPVGAAIGSSQTSQGTQANDPITNPLDCGWTNFKGCVAMVPYYLLFVPSSAVFSISGKIFDFAFGYSVQDTSYRSTFVVEGWGIVRDFCNMFFIFILLYIAFGTILNLHSVKTKEMIINVVIIGLLINFSLFATHVIIDASNILARVFYNSETIKITEKNPDGSVKAVDSGEFIKMSEAIVSKVNPQELLLNAGTVGTIPDKGGMAEETKSGEISLTTLVLIILLASVVNIVGTIVFISVALIFVGRVIGLWLAMIFVPFTFFTYAVPSLQDLEMVGWKKWWPETIKMAFLAPVFMFFMYLIVKFLNLKLDLINTAGKTGMDFVVSLLIPFAFIMILLWKAKQIATKMSGTIGEMAAKAGAAIGGAGLAVATGGAAMAMRGTLGRVGSSIANSERLKRAEARGTFGAKYLRNIGSTAGKGSFDVRATKLGAMAGKEMGVDMGKAKEGGFEKARADKVAYRQKRAKELEVGEDSEQTQAVRQAEHAFHAAKTDPVNQNALLRLNNGEPDQATADAAEATMNANPANQAAVLAFVNSRGLGGLERIVTARERAVGVAERALKDATDAMAAIPSTVPINDPTRIAAQAEITRLRNNRDAEINGGTRTDFDANNNLVTTVVAIGRDQAKNNLEARQAAIRGIEGPIHALENEMKRLENIKIGVNNDRRHDYAHTIQGAWSNALSSVVSLNEHSARGEREAANKILSGIEADKKITEHH